MTRRSMYLLACGAALLGLAACGGGGGGAGAGVLGDVFQRAFAQGPNDTPLDITNANLMVQLTQDPFEL